MTPDQIMKQMIRSGQQLQVKNEELKELGISKAQAEHDYRLQLRKTMLELKATGSSVTLIQDMAKGDPIISQLRMQRDIAEVLYDACRDKIRDLRLELEVMRSFLTWERAEMEAAGVGE